MLFVTWTALACVPEDRTIQALVDARAEQIGQDARMGARLALASGGLVAQVAPVNAETWQSADRLEVSPELAAVLGIDGPALVQSDTRTGSHHATWTTVEFSPEIQGRVELEVLRPRTTFKVSFLQNPGEEPGVYAISTVTVVDAEDDPVLEVDHTIRIGETEHQVVVPAPLARRDTGAAPHASWAEGGGYLPVEGTFLWSRTFRNKAQELESLTADEHDGDTWTSVARSDDWEHVLELDLTREGLDQ